MLVLERVTLSTDLDLEHEAASKKLQEQSIYVYDCFREVQPVHFSSVPSQPAPNIDITKQNRAQN